MVADFFLHGEQHSVFLWWHDHLCIHRQFESVDFFWVMLNRKLKYLQRPLALIDCRIQMVVPSLSTLFAISFNENFTNFRPSHSMHGDQFFQFLVLFSGPNFWRRVNIKRKLLHGLSISDPFFFVLLMLLRVFSDWLSLSSAIYTNFGASTKNSGKNSPARRNRNCRHWRCFFVYACWRQSE